MFSMLSHASASLVRQEPQVPPSTLADVLQAQLEAQAQPTGAKSVRGRQYMRTIVSRLLHQRAAGRRHEQPSTVDL